MISTLEKISLWVSYTYHLTNLINLISGNGVNLWQSILNDVAHRDE